MNKLKQGLKGVGGIRHAGKDKIKAQFDIVIKKLVNIQDLNGKAISLGWKRGSSANAGTTKEVVVSNGEAVWNEKMIVKGTLFGDPESDKFDEKDIVFSLKQDSKVIAKLSIDLGHFAKHECTYHEEFSFFKKPRSPTLQLAIHTRWLKLNSKLLVKQEDNTQRDKAHVDIDGQAYGLKTDDALTDTSVDTGTGSWEEDDADFRDDPFTTTALYEAESRRTHDEIEALRKQLRLVEGESSQRAKTIELQEKEVLELRRQLEIVEKRCSENEELVQRGYELESFMRQQLAIAQQEHKDELNLSNDTHKAELNRLHNELETERTRAQLSSLIVQSAPAETVSEAPTPATKTNPTPNTPTTPAPSNVEENNQIMVLEEEKTALQNRVESLEEELQQSSLSLVNMTDKLAHKNNRIESLLTQLNVLRSQLDIYTSTTSLSAAPTILSLNQKKYNKHPMKPLFAHPMLDQRYQSIVLLGFLILLSLCTLL